MRSRYALLAFALLVGLLPACSATKALFRGATASEVGRDGWLKGSVGAGEIEAVRSTQRVVIAIGSAEGTYVVRIDPKTLSFPTPPWGGKLVSSEGTGVNGESRVYRIPPGHDWDEVRAWYLEWFDFKPTK
jgi:hypothetical protein